MDNQNNNPFLDSHDSEEHHGVKNRLHVRDDAERAAEDSMREYPAGNIHIDEQTLDGAGAVLEAIARKRGCLIKGGDIDMEKAERILLTEFRAGKLGTISLEQPDKNGNGQRGEQRPYRTEGDVPENVKSGNIRAEIGKNMIQHLYVLFIGIVLLENFHQLLQLVQS